MSLSHSGARTGNQAINSSRASEVARFLWMLALGVVWLQGPMASRPAGASPLCDSLNVGRFDIVYVCPAAWRGQVARLAIHRAGPSGGGYTSIVAPAESIAACYGGGRGGIRAMMHSVLSNWGSPPRHLVLVGGFRSSCQELGNRRQAAALRMDLLTFTPSSNFVPR
jgi:hypothetical protein